MAAIEMAIVLPLLMVILFGIINFGTIFYNQIVITNAAREGARWGAINPTKATCTQTSSTGTSGAPPANSCEAANRAATNLITYGNAATPQSVGTVSAGVLTVAVTFDYGGIWIIKRLLAGNLSASSSMYLEPT